MSHGREETLPLWWLDQPEPVTEKLSGDVRADVVVVGAGMAGLCVAYGLAKAGRRVAVVDEGPVGGGETGRSTAHIASALDDGWPELERLFGPAGARLAAASHRAAADFIERAVAEESIACGFFRVNGYLFNPPPDEGTGQDLRAEMAAALRAGLETELVARAPLAFDTGPAVRFGNQARMDPLAFVRGLAQAVRRRGGRIFTGSRAVEVAGGRPARVTVAEGWHMVADAVVVATNVPINDTVAVHGKQAPSRTYAIAARAEPGATADALYWDTAKPYHYARFQPMADGAWTLIVGGEDHRTGTPAHGSERWARLEAWARARFPGMGAVVARWSGQVLEPVDGLGFIGHNPMDEDNVFIATGDSGNGITHGAIAGLLIPELILGRPAPWERLYDPARLSLKAVPAFADTNLHVAEHYAEWLTAGDVAGVEDIAPGSGAVLRSGLTKLAVYRDAEGRLYRRSAVCPHLKCIVAWNDAEHSWDCACHGSRFDRFGRVVNGPATGDLPEAE
jgi:glycine/D-amino acid oxidase-like deaminating enzyme/nitrite reductase/ring-hydroxylating ferredoxin subunit